jgi:hypothetical protein
MTKEEINKLVYARYPKKRKEDTCSDLKQRRDGLRAAYRKRLYDSNSIIK